MNNLIKQKCFVLMIEVNHLHTNIIHKFIFFNKLGSNATFFKFLNFKVIRDFKVILTTVLMYLGVRYFF